MNWLNMYARHPLLQLWERGFFFSRSLHTVRLTSQAVTLFLSFAPAGTFASREGTETFPLSFKLLLMGNADFYVAVVTTCSALMESCPGFALPIEATRAVLSWTLAFCSHFKTSVDHAYLAPTMIVSSPTIYQEIFLKCRWKNLMT